MSLQFIFGNSGSGKSHVLYQTVIEESVKHPEKNYIVLVPEQFTMQTQKDLCLMHPRGGIMNIDVLSFGRLAHRIFEELGQDGRKVLDDEGKNLILRKIAGNYEEKLTVLKGNLKKQGYISEVKSVISEFTQYGIDSECLDIFMDDINPDSYLYFKLQDIRMIYDGFEEYLSEKYITKEEMLDVLSGIVSRSGILQGSVIALDGFTGFTPVQDRLLGELLKVCDRVMITVEMDEREDPFIYRTPYQIFALSKQMVTSLVKIASDVKTEIADPVFLYDKPPKRFENNGELAFLESELFRYSGRRYDKDEIKTVSLHETRNPMAEAGYVAGEIRRLVREKGYRYRDIAVITADMNVYADPLERSCNIYGIPVFMDHKKSILLNAFVEYLRSLLSMAEQNFTYESVFRFMRTGLSGFSDDETDRLENYCLALGIKGYRNWQKPWVRKSAEAGEKELEMLNHLRSRFVEKIDGLVSVLKKRRKTVHKLTLAVYEFIVSEHMQERLAEMEQEFQNRGELAAAKEYAQIYRIVIDLFDKFSELLGDESISLKEYCALLDAGLEEAKVGVIPPGLDQVVIGDVERTRIKNIKALFFVGANDALLPGNSGTRGILSERDREQFEKRNLTLSPGPKEQIYIQKFYLYMNLTKPSDELYISWAKVSADGKSLRPAYIVNEIRRLFPGLRVADEDKRTLTEYEITEQTGMRILAEGVRDRRAGISEEWKELYTWFRKDGNRRENLEQILCAGFLKKRYPDLSPEQAGSLYPDMERISVTKMERFSVCAYAYFLSYGLRLSDREKYTFEPADLGNIAHKSLEKFSKKADRENLRWEKLPDGLRDQMISESVEESVLDYGNTVLFSTARNEYMISRIKKLIWRSVWALTKQLEKGDFIPGDYELQFGSGKIDRIDICKDEDENCVYVKVTDYKTGLKAFDITALCHGLQMQLPVYMNAAVQIEKRKYPDRKIVPAGIFYYRIQDPIVERSDNEADVENSILKELRLDGLVNMEGQALEHLEHGLSGTSLLIPVGKNKDGSLSKNSRVLTGEEFRTVLDYADKKAEQIRGGIRSGKVEAAPYQMKDETGCDYCPYSDICGFDLRISGCRYRKLEKYTMQEALERMHRETENSGGKDS